MAELSPMMQQYFKIKEENKYVKLLYLGDSIVLPTWRFLRNVLR